MIKAVLRDRKGPVVLLGLSGENVTRLMADEPILVDLAELGLPPLRIAILGGRTEADITQQLEQQYGPLPFTCPRCTRTSRHPDDKRHGYCGHCHACTGEPTP
ncbi:hypothetical protein [Streptomyces sp. AK08-02]|uniref:hypothetical protein n=1 Tax=Streptomyces sp. AK08-02 TaxID=3028654 RepID=UPI0029A53212|nr:hypothetical protein [Streptomyces sp. AK08-02]MDX3748713.1 hypothetical protein [Streptomyces sp. AK08-02]